jgi:hypothetical protein
MHRSSSPGPGALLWRSDAFAAGSAEAAFCKMSCRHDPGKPHQKAKSVVPTAVRTDVRPGPSDGLHILRTHVPPSENIHACPAGARCPSPDPLVPVARGRPRRRLGGRSGRASSDDPPASSAAARAARPAAAGTAGCSGAGVPVPRSGSCGLTSRRTPRACRSRSGLRRSDELSSARGPDCGCSLRAAGRVPMIGRLEALWSSGSPR